MSTENSDEAKLHKYVSDGKKSKLKSFLKSVHVNVDSMDVHGNTPLYNACEAQRKGIARLLLEKGANPNERCRNGETPVHVTATKSNVKIMYLLIQYGGDLRLHDSQNRTPKTLALFQTNPSLRRKMLAFIEEVRSNAKTQASRSNGNNQMNRLSIQPKLNDENPCTAGFGVLYKSPKDVGVTMLVPQIAECDIVHDHTGPTHNNGAFMIYESMKWKENHLVTIKRLHSSLMEMGQVDLLIEELDMLRKVNHFPFILGLMGICPSENAESLMLMFERAQVGSLFNILHEITLSKVPKLKSITEIALSVCDALIYLHEKNIYHCYVSSHSVILTSLHTAKLANLEYAVEKSKDPSKQKKSKIVDNHYLNCSYNWIAPELLNDEAPNELSDMYSFCVVIWELFNMRIPWEDMEWNDIKYEILNKHNQLQVNFDLIPLPFSRILKDGFSANQIWRMSFEEVKIKLDNFQNSLSNTVKPAAPGITKNVRIMNRTNSRDRIDQGMRKPSMRSKNNSFSEGIASLNDAVNSHEMGTLNSLDDFDKVSDPSTNSYIYCDAYKAEFYLSHNPEESTSYKKALTRRENSLDSKLRKANYLEHLNQGDAKRGQRKITRKQSSSRSNQLKANDVISNNQQPTPPSGAPPPLPPPLPTLPSPTLQQQQQPQQNSKTTTIPKQQSAIQPNNAHQTTSKTVKISSTLPPTPPPLPIPPIINSQLHNYQQTFLSTNNKSPITNLNQPLSFLITPSPTPVTTSQSQLENKSKMSAISPRSAASHAETSTPTFRSTTQAKFNQRSGRLEVDGHEEILKPSGNYSKFDSGISARPESKTTKFSNILHKSLDKEIIGSGEKVKNAKKLFDKEEQGQEEKFSNGDKMELVFNRKGAVVVPNNAASQQSRNLAYCFSSQSNNEIPKNQQNLISLRQEDLFKELGNIADNLARPTPDDKRRTYNAKNLNIKGDCVDSAYGKNKQLNQKLDLSIISLEDNNVGSNQVKNQFFTEQVEKNQNSKTSAKSNQNMLIQELKNKQVDIMTLPRSGSCNRLIEDSRYKYFNQHQQQQQAPRATQSETQTTLKPRSNSQISHKSLPFNQDGARMTTNSLDQHRSRKQQLIEQQAMKPLNAEELYCGHGSVRNLVQSYEVFPLKERCESDHKVRQIREERFHEMKVVYNKTNLHEQIVVLDEQKAVDNGSGEPQNENTALLVEAPNEQQKQSVMKKNLSIISEKNENSPKVNFLGASSNINTTSTTNGASPITANITNTTTNNIQMNTNNTSKTATNTTTTTKAIRHLDPIKFQYLDSSVGASGENLSSINQAAINRNTSNFNASTPIQLSNTNILGAKISNNSTNLAPTSIVTTTTTKALPKIAQRDMAEIATETMVNKTITTTNTSTMVTMIPNTKFSTDFNNQHPQQYSQFVKKYANSQNLDAGEDDYPDDLENDESDTTEDEDDNENDDDDDGDDDCSNDRHNDFVVENGDEIVLQRLYSLNLNKEKPPFLETNEKLLDLNVRELLKERAEKKIRNASNNKSSHYSSQEDFLSSIHIGESSMEFSDGVYLNDFDRLVTNQQQPAQSAQNQAPSTTQTPTHSATATANAITQKLRQQQISQNNTPPRLDNTIRENAFQFVESESRSNQQRKLNKTNDLVPSHSSPNEKSSPNTHRTEVNSGHIYRNVNFHRSESSTSAGAVSSVTSLPDHGGAGGDGGSSSVPTQMSVDNEKRSLLDKNSGSVKIDKHFIDTSKYKGYQYKLETTSNLSNQYHIKGLLTNEQTGHSLLVTNTKVKTPNMSTKVIIDS